MGYLFAGADRINKAGDEPTAQQAADFLLQPFIASCADSAPRRMHSP